MKTMAIYNTSFMANATSIVDIAQGVGTSMGEPFLMGNLMLLGFFLIFLILGLRHNFLEVIIIDSFLTSVIAILFFYAGLISAITILYPALIFFVCLVFFFMS